MVSDQVSPFTLCVCGCGGLGGGVERGCYKDEEIESTFGGTQTGYGIVCYKEGISNATLSKIRKDGQQRTEATPLNLQLQPWQQQLLFLVHSSGGKT